MTVMLIFVDLTLAGFGTVIAPDSGQFCLLHASAGNHGSSIRQDKYPLRWLDTLWENNSKNNRNNAPSPKTITATTLWRQIELQAYKSCYTSARMMNATTRGYWPFWDNRITCTYIAMFRGEAPAKAYVHWLVTSLTNFRRIRQCSEQHC